MKYVSLNDQLYRYVCEHRSNAADGVLNDLRERTAKLGDESRMQISPEQGAFFTILVAALGVKSAIEVGTFTGYSSICIARGLAESGRLICVDASAEWTAIAREFWRAAKVDHKIELRLGDAIPTLRSIAPTLTFDFAFIDANKLEYDTYYELILPRIRQNGIIVFDNMLWGAEAKTSTDKKPECEAVDRLNRKLAQDRRIESALLPIADGIQVCRKL
jgi:caffeoyl-CoA O-methyltransferase